MLLAEQGIRGGLVYSDVASGRTFQRPSWQELMTRVQEGDTIVVAFLDRLPTNLNGHAGATSDEWGTADAKASDRGTNW